MKIVLVLVVLVYHNQDVTGSMFDDLQRFRDNMVDAFDVVADKVVVNYQTLTQRMRRFFADEWSNVRSQVFPGATEMAKINIPIESSTVRSSLGRVSGALYFITPKPMRNITESTTRMITSTSPTSTTTTSTTTPTTTTPTTTTSTSTTEMFPQFKKKVMEHIARITLNKSIVEITTPGSNFEIF